MLGAIAFLTRLPVGGGERAWTAFRRRPATMVFVAYPLGLLLAVPVVTPLPTVTAAIAFPAWLYLLTGITHLDGLADLGDAAVVHGDPQRRRSVLRDTTTGVGALAAVGLAIAGLALAGAGIAGTTPRTAAVLVLSGEVAAKLAVLAVVVLGTPAHEGLGSAVAEHAGPGSLIAGATLTVPVVLVGGFPALAALAAGGTTALIVHWWARRHLGGTSGDVFGATNELARLAALHAGLTALVLGASVEPLPGVIG